MAVEIPLPGRRARRRPAAGRSGAAHVAQQPRLLLGRGGSGDREQARPADKGAGLRGADRVCGAAEDVGGETGMVLQTIPLTMHASFDSRFNVVVEMNQD